MKRIILVFLLLNTVFISSCDKMLEIDPRQSIDASAALSTKEGIIGAVADVYGLLKREQLYGRDLVAISESMADNVVSLNRAGGRLYNENLNQRGAHFTAIAWQLSYRAINEINLILEALPTSQLSDADKAGYEGEMRGLRALYYFNLLRMYAYEPKVALKSVDQGGVPISTKGVLAFEQVELPTRGTVEDGYKFLYSELTAAIAKAPATGGPARLTKTALQGLFAKVALYNEDYAVALAQANEVINSKLYKLSTQAGYISDWRQATHPETLFEVRFSITSESLGVNVSLQTSFTSLLTLTSTALGGYGDLVPTTAFLALFEKEDIRPGLFQKGIRTPVSLETTKYMGKSGDRNIDNVPVIRYSEVYLIRAEALAKTGKDADALADLNTLRSRVGVKALTGLQGNTLLDAISLERRLELSFEGDRWFDLKRRGKDIVKSPATVTYDDYRLLAQIPAREVQANPNLKQNIGY